MKYDVTKTAILRVSSRMNGDSEPLGLNTRGVLCTPSQWTRLREVRGRRRQSRYGRHFRQGGLPGGHLSRRRRVGPASTLALIFTVWFDEIESKTVCSCNFTVHVQYPLEIRGCSQLTINNLRNGNISAPSVDLQPPSSLNAFPCS